MKTIDPINHLTAALRRGVLWLAVLALAPSVLTAGEKLESTFTLSFRHMAGNQPLVMDSLRYAQETGESFSITRLSYLLSGFALENAEGERTELPDQVAWIDLEKRRTVVTLTSIPPGVYDRLHFFVGPSEAANHADPSVFPPEHPLNPNVNGLHWNWQGGFIFMAVEGKYRAGNEPVSGYAYHLARDPNRAPVTVNAQLDLRNSLAGRIDLDVLRLLTTPVSLSFQRDGNSTHAHPGDAIASALVTNLSEAFRLEGLRPTEPEIFRASAAEPLDLPNTFTPYPFKTGRSFPIPKLPRDNPLLRERVTLGERLFRETALSRDGSISCASCHVHRHALADPRPVSIGIEGREGTRNAMPLFNLAWKSSFFWDGRASSLRTQALMPIADHVEMDQTLETAVAILEEDDLYLEGFARAFGSAEITEERIGLALENFLLTLTSYRSKFDRVAAGKARFTESEQRGFELFTTEYEPRSQRFGADCFHCHGGPLFTDNQFRHNGLTSVDPGRERVTGEDRDRGKFATPSLRNVALTAPYMHDGRFQTLEEVVAHYDSGVERSSTLDANLAKHPRSGLGLTKEDRDALVAFLKTLTDEQFLTENLSTTAPRQP